MPNTIDQTQLISIISSFFNIESTQLAGADDGYQFRCVGRLIDQNTEKGFDDLSSALEDHQFFAVIRPLSDQHELLIFPEIPHRKNPKPILHILMFSLTLLSVLLTGGLYAQQSSLPGGFLQALWALATSGWPFALSLLAILGAHEFGHYFAGKKHGVNVTLPRFMTFTFSTIWTMGGFISMRSIPKKKKKLFGHSVTGPISGLIVSIIVLFVGMNLSELSTIPLYGESAAGLQMEGNSLLYLLIKYISFGRVLPQPPGLDGLPLLIFWFRFFFTGMPFPWGAQDVMLHPVAWAGWAGLFVITINLIPVGQLDGGHIFQSVFGAKTMQIIYPIVLAALVTFGFFWAGWWTWAAILFFFGQRQAQPLDQVSKLDNKRRLLGILMIIIFVITFIPVPMTIAGF